MVMLFSYALMELHEKTTTSVRPTETDDGTPLTWDLLVKSSTMKAANRSYQSSSAVSDGNDKQKPLVIDLMYLVGMMNGYYIVTRLNEYEARKIFLLNVNEINFYRDYLKRVMNGKKCCVAAGDGSGCSTEDATDSVEQWTRPKLVVGIHGACANFYQTLKSGDQRRDFIRVAMLRSAQNRFLWLREKANKYDDIPE